MKTNLRKSQPSLCLCSRSAARLITHFILQKLHSEQKKRRAALTECSTHCRVITKSILRLFSHKQGISGDARLCLCFLQRAWVSFYKPVLSSVCQVRWVARDSAYLEKETHDAEVCHLKSQNRRRSFRMGDFISVTVQPPIKYHLHLETLSGYGTNARYCRMIGSDWLRLDISRVKMTSVQRDRILKDKRWKVTHLLQTEAKHRSLDLGITSSAFLLT